MNRLKRQTKPFWTYNSSFTNSFSADFLVVGSGVAGLSIALALAAGGRVLLITKDLLEGNTRYAQGGVAAAMGADDSWQEHFADTMTAGAGLCDPGAVRALVKEGPRAIADLLARGTGFDRQEGALSLTREGGHRRRRVLHAGGDATGWEIEKVLARAVQEHANITLHGGVWAVDLLLSGGSCSGVLAMNESGERLVYSAKATVLATGGAGQVYKYTTNSPVITGDGLAMAYRAGAEVMDVEFMQFHPTALALPGAPTSLITEAARGEGGLLLDARGQRFMSGRHPLAELAPRDVVARAAVQVMAEDGTDHVWLDLRHLKHLNLPERFPTVFKTCLEQGLDIRQDLLPVAPVAHYYMGGIRTDLDGRTGIPGLFSCGEAACFALHGANRLASNSLLEGLVFGRRAAVAALNYGAESALSEPTYEEEIPCASGDFALMGMNEALLKENIQELLWEKAGLNREKAGLETALSRLEDWRAAASAPSTPAALEALNMLEVGRLITFAALLRTESRGAHFRSDFPAPDDTHWLQHIVLQNDNHKLFATKGGKNDELAEPFAH